MHTVYRLIIAGILVILPLLSWSQSSYFDKIKVPKTPQIFEPGFFSLSDRYEFGSVFSKDNKEFFFAVNVDSRSEIMYSRYEDNEWSAPITIVTHPRFGFNDPFLSNDEKRLYYISDLSTGSYDESIDHDIWYSERGKDGWSVPINAGPEINSPFNEYYISFNNKGTMYFASNKAEAPNRNHDFDIYRSDFSDGEFESAERLDTMINTKNYEADVFIAPDESYIIFVSFKRSGLGQGDLYISFKNDMGAWTKAMNMGPTINSKNHELCPFVTKDGRYLFFTSNEDLYWVSTEIIKSLKP